VVVSRDDEDAAMRRRAVGVAMFQRVTGPVDAGPLAVPEAEHANDRAVRIGLHLLRAEDGGRREILVDRRQEFDTRLFRQLAGAPHLQVDGAERRAAIAGNEAARVQSGGAIAARLVENDAHQCLRAGQEDTTAFQRVAVAQVIGRKQILVCDMLVHRSFSRNAFWGTLAGCGE
jgi:hypothetical protein